MLSYTGVCIANASAWFTAGVFLWIAYGILMKRMERSQALRSADSAQKAD
jgi:uncharacterized protein with PQ loop repeat